MCKVTSRKSNLARVDARHTANGCGGPLGEGTAWVLRGGMRCMMGRTRCRRRARGTRAGRSSGYSAVVGGSAPADVTPPECRGLDSAPPALPLTVNSHVTAAAWAAKAAGVALPGEEDRTLAATVQVYVQGCNTCGDSTHWDLANGLRSFFAERGAPAKATDRWRTCADEATRATLDDVARVLGAGGQVIATFCYGRAAVIPAIAARTPCGVGRSPSWWRRS
jgi:hypothetical protein